MRPADPAVHRWADIGPEHSRPSAVEAAASKKTLRDGVEGFPATPAGAFVVDGRTVTTTSRTSFQLGSGAGSFADLAIGQRVHVTGSSTAGDLVASVVRIQNVQVDLPVALNGVMLDFSGAVSAFAFTVGSEDGAWRPPDRVLRRQHVW